jgi:hypothetical protein
MNRIKLIGILIALAVVAVLVWAWWLRASQYPKEYKGDQPSGPGAPMRMDRPMGVGGQGGSPAPEQPRTGAQPF